MKKIKEEFEVATFDSIEDNAIVHEGGLTYDNALQMAKKIFRRKGTFGVEIVSQSPDSLEPIKWIKTK